MTMGKDSRIARVEVDWDREREHERVVWIVLAKGRLKREIRDGAMGANVNVFNGQTFTVDNCTCTIVWHSVGAVFPGSTL